MILNAHRKKSLETYGVTTYNSVQKKNTLETVVVAKVMDYKFIVSEFELQSRYYIYFRTRPLG